MHFTSYTMLRGKLTLGEHYDGKGTESVRPRSAATQLVRGARGDAKSRGASTHGAEARDPSRGEPRTMGSAKTATLRSAT